MAFLQRVVNAKGRVKREYAAGSGRMDLAIEYMGEWNIIVLKKSTLPKKRKICYIWKKYRTFVPELYLTKNVVMQSNAGVSYDGVFQGFTNVLDPLCD